MNQIKKIKLLREISKNKALKTRAIICQEYEMAAWYRDKEKTHLDEYYKLGF